MSVYSERFFIGSVTSNGELLATVPSGTLWILRDLELLNIGAAGGSMGIYVSAGTGGAATVIRKDDAQVNEWVQWDGRVVMNAGDQLYAVNSVGQFQLIATGYSFPKPV